jgi:hypothetical protein
LGIGSTDGYSERNKGLKWCQEGIKITGIFFSYDHKLKHLNNIQWVLDNMRTKLNMWKWRKMSLLGKIQIVKTHGTSQILYITNMLSIPDKFISEVNKIIYNFVWNGPDKVKRANMISDYNGGGLKMPDIDVKIKGQRIMWVKRMLNPARHTWKALAHHILQALGGLYIFRGVPDKNAIIKAKLSKFYEECLIS